MRERETKEQEHFKSGRGYVDQVFVFNQLVEIYREEGVVCCVTELGKTYDKVYKEELWMVL